MPKKRNPEEEIAEIRTIMERVSRFHSLSGFGGILAGIYSLSGSWIACSLLGFEPLKVDYHQIGPDHLSLIGLGIVILLLSLTSVILLTVKRAFSSSERLWNPASRRLVIHMAVPLFTGGILMLILFRRDLTGLIIPVSLLFYGLSLVGSGKDTFPELSVLGFLQIGLGLAGTAFIQYSFFLWITGFGILNILFGLYLYLKHER